MMETSGLEFEHISVTVNENDLESGALKILQIIRPRWPVASIRFKVCIISMLLIKKN